MQPLEFSYENGYTTFSLSKIIGYDMFVANKNAVLSCENKRGGNKKDGNRIKQKRRTEKGADRPH
jgi:hypothetical protein